MVECDETIFRRILRVFLALWLLLPLASLAHAEGLGGPIAQDIYSSSGQVTVSGLADKGGQVFNVKAYGAVGDGATDDSSAIGSANSAASAASGTVFFPPGIYLFDSPLTIPSGVHYALSPGAVLRCNYSGGSTACVSMQANSGIGGGTNIGRGSFGQEGAIIDSSTSATATYLLEVGDGTVLQNVSASGIVIDGSNSGSSAFSSALVGITSGGQPSYLKNSTIIAKQGASYPGLVVSVNTNDNFAIENVEVNGGAPPCELLASSDGTFRAEGIFASNLTCEHATNATTGSGNYPQIKMEGSGSENCMSNSFISLNLEGLSTDSTTQPLMTVDGCYGTWIQGLFARPIVASSAQYAVELETANSSHLNNLVILGFHSNIPHFLNDLVDSRTFTQRDVTYYSFSNASATGNTAGSSHIILDANGENPSIMLFNNDTGISAGSSLTGSCTTGNLNLSRGGQLQYCSAGTWTNVTVP